MTSRNVNKKWRRKTGYYRDNWAIDNLFHGWEERFVVGIENDVDEDVGGAYCALPKCHGLSLCRQVSSQSLIFYRYTCRCWIPPNVRKWAHTRNNLSIIDYRQSRSYCSPCLSWIHPSSLSTHTFLISHWLLSSVCVCLFLSLSCVFAFATATSEFIDDTIDRLPVHPLYTNMSCAGLGKTNENSSGVFDDDGDQMSSRFEDVANLSRFPSDVFMPRTVRRSRL